MESSGSAEVILKEIEESFAALAELDLTVLTETEVTDAVVRAQRIRSMADAVCQRTAGALDVSQAWQADGARSPIAWITHSCRVPRSRASAAVSGARALRKMPATEVAMSAGAITADHARLLSSAQRANPEAFAADGEARLLGCAAVLSFSQFEIAVRYWRHRNAPDDVEDEANNRWLDRRLHCSRSFEGMVVIDALLDPITGAIVQRELERLTQLELEADLAEARERLGRDVPLAELRRTPAQRRADALRVMAERSAAKPADALEPRVLLHVLAGNESVARMCELSTGEVVTPGEVLPILDRADVERAIFDGPSKVIDLGIRRRLFTGATRTAVQLRDRTCQGFACDVPFDRCEVDHKRPYSEGGLTVQDNGRCLCKYHHRRRRPD